MNRIRWSILGAIGVLLGAMPIATSRQVWAGISSEPQLTLVQSQAVQVAVSLLLNDNDDEQNQANKLYLPLITR
jgi:hypothetical protein